MDLDGNIIKSVDFENDLKSLSKHNIFFLGNEMFFISGFQKNYGIGKIDINSLEYTQITNEHCSNFNIKDEWIYFVKEKDLKLYKIKLDGTEETQVGDVSAGRGGISIIDDWIYFYSQLDACFRIKIDGSVYEML